MSYQVRFPDDFLSRLPDNAARVFREGSRRYPNDRKKRSEFVDKELRKLPDLESIKERLFEMATEELILDMKADLDHEKKNKNQA
jgi:hypothetical protein